MDARRAFAELIEREEDAIPLDEAALRFAAVEYAGLYVHEYLGRLDRMAAELRGRVSREESPGRVIAVINA